MTREIPVGFRQKNFVLSEATILRFEKRHARAMSRSGKMSESEFLTLLINDTGRGA